MNVINLWGNIDDRQCEINSVTVFDSWPISYKLYDKDSQHVFEDCPCLLLEETVDVLWLCVDFVEDIFLFSSLCYK